MYKQAAQLKLRFDTPKGVLSVEQMWDLTKDELAQVAKKLRKKIKDTAKSDDEELTFLEEKQSPAQKEDTLRFNIVKDIYTTKVAAEKESLEEAQKRQKNQKILELIARKQDQELEGKSIEELQAMLQK